MKNRHVKLLKQLIFLYTLLVIGILAIWPVLYQNVIGDETWHYRQIVFFTIWPLTGELELHGAITMIPGYHAMLAILSYLFQNNRLWFVRVLSFAVNFASVILFYYSARKIDEENSMAKTVKYFIMPVIFPFFLLVYTDVFAITMFLPALYFVLNKKYTASGITGILAMMVRQNNIVWFGFLFCVLYFQEYGFRFSFVSVRKHLKRSWSFIPGFLLFAGFVIINQGFSIGDPGSHPVGIHVGNVFLMLFLFWFFFLPQNITSLGKIKDLVKEDKKYILYVGLLFLVFMLFYKNDHPYNIKYTFNLRTRLLLFSDSGLWQRVLYFIPCAWAALTIRVAKLKENYFYLLWPFTVIYLLPSWLIEQRYYMMTYALYIMFKEKESDAVEYITIGYWLVLTAVLYRGIVLGYFFL